MIRGKMRILQEKNIVPEMIDGEVMLAIARPGRFCFVLVIENFSRRQSKLRN